MDNERKIKEIKRIFEQFHNNDNIDSIDVCMRIEHIIDM